MPPILNCHPGILPYYKGCNSPEWAFLNKDNIGATVHLMNERYIDGGKIIFKKIFRRKKFKITKISGLISTCLVLNFIAKVLKNYFFKNFNKLIYNKVAINSKDAIGIQ